MGRRAGITNQKKVLNVPTYILRQSLRLALLEAIGTPDKIKVGTSISASRKQGGEGVTLTFEVNGQLTAYNS
jgi:hypothetical protein